jgi:hypothetical protein
MYVKVHVQMTLIVQFKKNESVDTYVKVSHHLRVCVL